MHPVHSQRSRLMHTYRDTSLAYSMEEMAISALSDNTKWYLRLRDVRVCFYCGALLALGTRAQLDGGVLVFPSRPHGPDGCVLASTDANIGAVLDAALGALTRKASTS